MTALKDREKGRVWLFLDDNQRVRGTARCPGRVQDLGPDDQLPQYPRDRPRVHKKYKGELEPRIGGPRGREIELLIDDPIERSRQGRAADREGGPLGHIVVLSAHNRGKSDVGRGPPLGYFYVDEPKPSRPVRALLIHRAFKGLEGRS